MLFETVGIPQFMQKICEVMLGNKQDVEEHKVKSDGCLICSSLLCQSFLRYCKKHERFPGGSKKVWTNYLKRTAL